MTVLAVVVAASIAFTLVSQGTQVLRSEAALRDGEEATRATQELLREVERELTLSPSRHLEMVLPGEAPRVCDGEGTVEAGELWPDGCPLRWEYDLEAVEEETYVTLTPPSRQQPLLEVAATATVGEQTVTGTQTFRPAGSVWALWSAASLDLSDLLLAGADPHAPLSAPIYTGGTLTMPPAGMLNLEDALLAAEDGFSGDVTDTAFRYRLGPTAPEGDIRDLVPTQQTAAALRAGFLQRSSAACEPSNVARFSDGTPSTLCLSAGTDVPLAGGGSDTFPAADAVLLLPSDSGTLQVLTASQLPPDPFCQDCDLAAEVAAAADAGDHPASLDFWDLFGEVPYPHTGLVAAPTDVYVGLCGEGFSDPSGSCDSYNTGGDGAVFDGPMTVLAGTPNLPADIYLSGPLLADPADLSLVASSRFVLPFWARPDGGDLALAANFVSLGQGGASSAVETRSGQGAGGPSGLLTVEGSIYAANLQLDAAAFAELRFSPAPGPHPHMVAADGRWEAVSFTRGQ